MFKNNLSIKVKRIHLGNHWHELEKSSMLCKGFVDLVNRDPDNVKHRGHRSCHKWLTYNNLTSTNQTGVWKSLLVILEKPIFNIESCLGVIHIWVIVTVKVYLL